MCDLLLSKASLENDLNLTPVVNEIFFLDIRTPTDINHEMKNDSSHLINLSLN